MVIERDSEPPRALPPRGDRRATALGAGLVLAFIATRVLWLRGAPASSQYWEEGYRWLAVELLREGAPLPLSALQADHYQGGSLVVIALAYALTVLGLPSFVALKAVAVGFSAATCAALFAVARGLFGRTAGAVAAALYLCGPPLVAYWGVVAMGFHAESALFALACLGLVARLATGPALGLGSWLAAGLVAGLGMWFAPTTGIAVLASVLAWPLLAPCPRPRQLAAAGLGLALGLAPWLAYELAHDFAGLARAGEVFGLASASDAWRTQGLLARAFDLALRAPGTGLLAPDGAPVPAWLLAAVWVPAAAGLAAAVVRTAATLRGGPRRAPADARAELFFVVYGAVFLAAYLGSRFTLPLDASPIAYRLLVPAAVLLLPLLARSAARALAAHGAARGLAAGALALALVALASTTLGFARRYQAPGTPLTLEHADVTWGHLLARKHGDDLVAATATLARLADARRERVLGGLGWGLQSAYEQVGTLRGVASALAALPPRDRQAVEGGIRFWGGQRRADLAKHPGDPDLARALARLDELDGWLRRPPLVLITLDTTRVDHLSCYGYDRRTSPNLDAFAARAVRFDRAWSTSSWTLPAHASLFTSAYPSRHGADYDPKGAAVLGDVIGMPVARHVRAGQLPESATTLAERLHERGYRTGAFVAGPWLHRGFGLLQGFETKDDAVRGFGGRPAAEITAAALHWLGSLPPEAPYFLFVNYFDPHAPYEPVGRYPEFPRAGEPLSYDYDALMRGEATLTADARAVLRDRYDAEIRDMDASLGRLLGAVLARPGGERALVVITADHGEALGDGGRLGHGYWLAEELTRIPLLARFPYDAEAGTRRSEPIQLVDVAALLAPWLELSLPADSDGLAPGQRDAAYTELRRELTTALRFGSAFDRDLAAVVRWPLKLERSDDGAERLSRLVDSSLAEAPEPAPAAAAPLRALLDAHAARAPAAPVRAPEAVDAETLEALRALGYVE